MDQYTPPFKLFDGDLFPDFILKDQNGKEVKISSAPEAGLKTDYKVVFFYPQDDTPTCTKEVCGLRDNFELLKNSNCTIVGISPDDEKSHQKFIKKYFLNFDLLVDTDHLLASALGIWGLKFTFGREYEGLHRVSYILDGNMKIKRIIYPVESGIHTQQILDVLQF